MRLVFFLALIVPMELLAQLPRFDIQGHRGARGLQPENTIPAFITALDSGATTLEMDVVITRDKQVVVSHEPYMSALICLDSAGNPVTARNEKKMNIYHMTYDQVHRCDCGSRPYDKFPEQKKQKTFKPLLSDVIVTVENQIKNFTHYEVDYSIEIKSDKSAYGIFQPDPAEFSDLVYNLINQYLPLDRVVIQSFDFRVLRYWHKTYPDVRLAALIENPGAVDEKLNSLGFVPSVYSPEYRLLTRDIVEHCHALKMRVVPWTVNTVTDMIKLRAWNTDGIITDYPNRAKQMQALVSGTHH